MAKDTKQALIVIDIQNDYFPGGKMELDSPVKASENAAKLITYFRQKAWPIVFIQHISNYPGATFFLPDTPGVQIHASVAPLQGETVIQKHFPNSFRATNLQEHLTSLGVKKLVICGMMSHMCVDSGSRAAFDFGYEVVVASDACTTRALEFQGVKVPAAHVHASFMAALSGLMLVAPTADVISKL